MEESRESDRENSDAAYDEHKASGRSGQYRQRIFEKLKESGEPMTDRQLMEALEAKDPNLIRPEVTRLKDDGILVGVGKVTCPVTGHKVRLSRLSGRPLTERGRKHRVSVLDQRLRACQFIEVTSLVPEDWRDWFWEVISDGAPFSWGDNNRTLVTASRLREWCNRSLDMVEEEEAKREDIDAFLDMLQGLGETYIDMEN